MDWNDLQYFLSLARQGSVRKAGAALGVSHSTVTRRVESLETQLSTRLFDRHRDGFLLTDAGHELLATAERVEREMLAVERGLVGQDERLAGSVALTCCDNFVGRLLLSELASFCDDHPEIELCFTTDSRSFDLSRREADIAIRILARGVEPPEHLIGERLAPLNIANYVATEHAARLNPTLDGQRWISGLDPVFHRQILDDSSYPQGEVWGAFSSLELLVNSAQLGFGLAVLPTYVGDSVATLERLAEPDLRYVADLWMVSHPDLRNNARLRAARRAVSTGIRRYESLFTGDGWPDDAPLRPEINP